MFDLGPAAAEMSRLVAGTDDEQLDRATPCAEWSVADLLAHINQLVVVFTDNARKHPVDPPEGLPEDWRDLIPRRLEELAQAWRAESAWQGRVSAGGVEMDAADNAVVAIEELTVHGWDLATATGQRLHVPEGSLDQIDRFLELFVDPGTPGEGPFGPEAPAPSDGTRLDRLIARTGREPGVDA